MPSYEFTCPTCGGFDRRHPMAEVPESVPCPRCRRQARRRISGGVLLRSGSAGTRLLDATARTAAEPSLVAAPPPRRSPRVTRNPLHRKLPRS
ncbi:FmdB family zinc ribbon protein [Nocardia miyunensis]|uniref:FmdB family zinc ribbon protein n=1 Tax=Nocardia miyunensis TaxID=282684 RepID=UPI0008350FD6|nr:FmdB family zinc ribbon protein [Nocardia miyunensis]